jgi:hypothetical protein
MWSALPKTQRRVKLRYSPRDDTPTAATLAVTTGRVSLIICKQFFCFGTPVHSRSDTPPVVTATVPWWQKLYRHMGCSDLSNIGPS